MGPPRIEQMNAYTTGPREILIPSQIRQYPLPPQVALAPPMATFRVAGATPQAAFAAEFTAPAGSSAAAWFLAGLLVGGIVVAVALS
jgi:hypothetical protein